EPDAHCAGGLRALRHQVLRDLLFARATILRIRDAERDARWYDRAEHGERQDPTPDADEMRDSEVLRDLANSLQGNASPLRQKLAPSVEGERDGGGGGLTEGVGGAEVGG